MPRLSSILCVYKPDIYHNQDMVDSLQKPGFEEIRPGIKVPAKETLLTPRFYTTDFDEMARMDISVNEDELQAILEEFRADYNRHHFVRDAEFEQSWEHIDGETRRLFVEFLERSCTAEFSGFLLYKELICLAISALLPSLFKLDQNLCVYFASYGIKIG